MCFKLFKKLNSERTNFPIPYINLNFKAMITKPMNKKHKTIAIVAWLATLMLIAFIH